MKQKLLKKSAIVAVLLFCAIPAFSQGAIYNPQKDSEFSIIRNYMDKVDITYNLFTSTTSFNYIDRNSMNEFSAEITVPFTVSDFVVFDDSVFFCGFTNGGSCGDHAVYGYFDINDVFFYNGVIHYGNFNTDPDYCRITRFDKLDVMRSAAGETHLILIGEGYPDNVSKGTVQNDTANRPVLFEALVDLTVNSTLNSDIANYFINDTNLYDFDDVTLTNNYAIVSAHKQNDNYITSTYEIFYYKKPINAGDNIFTQSILPGTSIARIYPWESNPATLELPYYDEVIVTRMNNDGFATLCHKYDANDNDYLVLSVYSDPIQSQPILYRVKLPYYDNCQEMIYNPRQA